jgi:hypothetical protein
MTPAARNKWLIRHNAPKNMRLVTDLELTVITAGLHEVQAQLKASQEEIATLKGAIALGQENCDAVYEDLRGERDHHKDRLAKLIAHLKNPESGWNGPWEELEEYEEKPKP